MAPLLLSLFLKSKPYLLVYANVVFTPYLLVYASVVFTAVLTKMLSISIKILKAFNWFVM